MTEKTITKIENKKKKYVIIEIHTIKQRHSKIKFNKS